MLGFLLSCLTSSSSLLESFSFHSPPEQHGWTTAQCPQHTHSRHSAGSAPPLLHLNINPLTQLKGALWETAVEEREEQSSFICLPLFTYFGQQEEEEEEEEG